MLSPPKRVKVLTNFQDVVAQKGKQGVMGYFKNFWDNPLWPEKKLKIHQKCEKNAYVQGQKPTFLEFHFIEKWPNFCAIMANLTWNHIFRGEKVRRGMYMPLRVDFHQDFFFSSYRSRDICKKPFSKKWQNLQKFGTSEAWRVNLSRKSVW